MFKKDIRYVKIIFVREGFLAIGIDLVIVHTKYFYVKNENTKNKLKGFIYEMNKIVIAHHIEMNL
jgi:hypothetical protein